MAPGILQFFYARGVFWGGIKGEEKGRPPAARGASLAPRDQGGSYTKLRNSLIKRRRYNPLQYQTRRSKQEH